MELIELVQGGKQPGLTAVVKHAEQFISKESRATAKYVDMLEKMSTKFPTNKKGDE